MNLKNKARDRVVYYYDSEVGNFHYGPGHPMKPFRIHLTHDLVINYNLYRHMSIYRPHLITAKQMTTFHSDDYIAFLSSITPTNFFLPNNKLKLEQFTLGPQSDCPIFDGMFEFNQRSVGGSVDGALRLCYNQCDTAINWSGGFHHAKKAESSGFCYINDIVLAILELLKHFARVLYIDIDVHHGDRVEEAFYATNRVVSLSLHKYGGGVFPGTGNHRDSGMGIGKGHAVNFPLDDGIDDASYHRVFGTVIDALLMRFQPSAVVLQCGADSLSGDKIGVFNLSSRGHGGVVRYLKERLSGAKVPLLVVGGGGYSVRNVARLWCYETGVLCGKENEMAETIPHSDLMSYYAPTFKLHIESVKDMLNKNTKRYLEDMTGRVLQQMKQIEIAPSVQMNTHGLNRQSLQREEEREEKEDVLMAQSGDNDRNESELAERVPDERVMAVESFVEAYVAPANEMYDGDADQDTGLQTLADEQSG